MAARSARRPLGITLLAALVMLIGVAHIVMALQYIGIISWGDADFPGGDWLGALVFAFDALVALLIGYGLWTRNSGALIFVNLLAVFGVVSAFMALIGRTATSGVLVTIILNVALLIYCNSRPVRAAFKL